MCDRLTRLCDEDLVNFQCHLETCPECQKRIRERKAKRLVVLLELNNLIPKKGDTRRYVASGRY